MTSGSCLGHKYKNKDKIVLDTVEKFKLPIKFHCLGW